MGDEFDGIFEIYEYRTNTCLGFYIEHFHMCFFFPSSSFVSQGYERMIDMCVFYRQEMDLKLMRETNINNYPNVDSRFEAFA